MFIKDVLQNHFNIIGLCLMRMLSMRGGGRQTTWQLSVCS
jgi:hypothetical protein